MFNLLSLKWDVAFILEGCNVQGKKRDLIFKANMCSLFRGGKIIWVELIL
jgi:hypothetical protein